MVLSDIELRAEINEGRLIFTPALKDGAIQSASIDLGLHNVYWRPDLPAGKGIEVSADLGAAEAYSYMKQETGQSLELKPGDFVLGETAEAMSMPRHLCGWIEGKSGRARHGLIVHCTAPHIAPGWGATVPKRITLELVNLGKLTVKLQAGIAIAQLIVMRLGLPSAALYSGQHLEKGTGG